MKLFPRLPNRFAQDVFAEQSALSLDEIQGATSHPLLIWPATGADRIRDSELSALRSTLIEVVEKSGYPSPLGRTAQTPVDIGLARILWETPGLSPAEAGFGDVWSFLALVLAPEVVWWRATGSTNIERFVATDLTRHTLARLWWRAHLFTWGLTDPEEGWELWRSSAIGEAELDQIQTRRGGYGRSPKAFRSLVRVYPAVMRRADEIEINRRTFWRQTYLRWILRLGAFTNFSGIAESDLDEDLLAVAAEAAARAISASSEEAEDREPDLAGGTSDEPEEFDALPLNSLVVQLAEAVRASGEVVREDLATAFERVSGIQVPAERAEILNGIAWQGRALHYLAHDETNGRTIWRPGSVLPAPDRRWGTWSIQSFRAHVAKLNGDRDEKTLCSELFVGRAGQTVRRVVRAATREA
jgi:hypothetical protein